MQTHETVTTVNRVRTWKDGHTSTTAACTDFTSFNVAWQTAKRPKPADLQPTTLRFHKTRGQGLRGLALRNSASSGYLSEAGGISSPLSTAGEIFTSVLSDEVPAYNQALGSLADAIRPADMSIDLFQWRQTAKTVDRLLHFVETTKRSYHNIVRRQGPAKEFANLYLEFTYGIQPTVETLYAAYNKLMEAGLAANRLVHFRGRGRITRHWTERSNVTLFSYTNVSIPYEIFSSVRCQVDVWLKPDLSRLQKLAQYTSLNPVSWAYEMMLYSFVIDWFWNFGGYLRALETSLIYGAKFHSGTATYTWEKHTLPVDGNYVAADHESSVKTLTGYHNYRLYDRRILPSFPLPRPPQLNANFGWRRILNAAALLAQFLPDMHRRAHSSTRTGSKARAGSVILPI